MLAVEFGLTGKWRGRLRGGRKSQCGEVDREVRGRERPGDRSRGIESLMAVFGGRRVERWWGDKRIEMLGVICGWHAGRSWVESNFNGE